MRLTSLFLPLSIALLSACASTRLTDVQLDSLTKCRQTLWQVKTRLIQAGFRFESESATKLATQWRRESETMGNPEKRGELFLKYEIWKIKDDLIQWKELQSKSPSVNSPSIEANQFYGDPDSGIKVQRIARERVCGNEEFQYLLSK